MLTLASTFWYALAADFIVVIHFAFVLFVLLGLIFIYTGGLCQWNWVRNRKFRISHLGAIGFVVVEVMLKMVCPLTTWELTLREKAGQTMPEDYSFVAYYVSKMLYYQAEPYVFNTIYVIVFIAILCSWFVVKPHPGRKQLSQLSQNQKLD